MTDPRPGKGACLVVIYGGELGKRYDINAAKTTIGRSSSCDIQLDRLAVSRQHARLRKARGSIVIQDLGSTNGTFVNTDPIDEHPLRDGDFVKVGGTIFKFLSGGNVEVAYHEEIHRLTTIDHLTQTYNKRSFLESLEREHGRAVRHKRPLSLVAFAVEKVEKLWNKDQDLAEDVLRAFAGELKAGGQDEDMIARHSDRVLVGLLLERDAASARSFCETFVERLARSKNGVLAQSSVSIGVADLVSAKDPQELLREVLRRLEAAKRLGGTRIVDYAVPVEDGGELQSIFISYGGPDQSFAKKLNEALKVRGVQTFFFHEDAPPGDKLHDVMRAGVNAHDRVILVCSKDSLERPGLLNELEETLAREARDGGATYLLPIRLDDYVIDRWQPKKADLAQTIRDRVIADFRDHDEPAAFVSAVARVLDVLAKPAR